MHVSFALFVAAEYEQIGILHHTNVITKLKEKMDEIDFLIFYYTGKQSKKQKKLGKKVYKDEQEQDEIDVKNQYEKIVKKIPKNLRIYVKVRFLFLLKFMQIFSRQSSSSSKRMRLMRCGLARAGQSSDVTSLLCCSTICRRST